MTPHGLVLHGGAGAILRQNMSPANERSYRAKLQEALEAGYAVLGRGGPAPHAVVVAIKVLEDSPLFNAGYGAVLNADGICELDAAIMDGRTQAAGAVAGVRRIRNPITLAWMIMEHSPHVMLTGEGAEKFAEESHCELLPNAYFVTERRVRELARAKELELKHPTGRGQPDLQERIEPDDILESGQKFGTVGCAALDQAGNLAAGTSTGGLTNKRFGRVGDSPIIGAGTYANNLTCALSCTGQGEYFIRAVVGHEVSAQMEYRGVSLEQAARAALGKVETLGGTGGLVGIDRDGNVTMPFNTAGMYRGFKLSNGKAAVSLFGSDD